MKLALARLPNVALLADILPVNTPIAAPILPTFALPVTVNLPPVDKLPADKLPVIDSNPDIPRLPILALPVTLNEPPVDRLPPDTLPVAEMIPALSRLPTLALPVI